MIKRLRGLFQRYSDRHLSINAPGFALSDADGQPLGYIDRVVVQHNCMRLEGWSTARLVRFTWEGGQAVQHPHLHREDVSRALGIRAELGFVVEAPVGLGPYHLLLDLGEGGEVARPISEPSARFAARARRRLKARFVLDLLRLLPAFWGWRMTGDPAYRQRIKTGLRLDAITQAGPIPDALFAPEDAPPAPEDTPPPLGPITIVLPVYNAFDLLGICLSRIEAHTDLPWHLVVVEDASPDERVRPYLRDWARAREGQVTLLENDENLGFIGSVNRGLDQALSRGAHVVLLNSDALVPELWASRLIAPLEHYASAASVTPMSNDAEIFSVPAICQRSVLHPGEGDAIDRVARQLNPGIDLCEAPTGVGFCMALHVDYLRQVPRLDPAFGRGYGEEVDWCQRIRALGGRHLGLPGLFVEHRGGESFGLEEKRALVAKNNALIASRYPDYDREVQTFIQDDPLIGPRLALAIGLVAARGDDPVPVYLAHSFGGGAEHYLQNRIDADLKQGQCSLILRVGGIRRFQLEVYTPWGESVGQTDHVDLVTRLLAPLPARRIIYSCGVGDRDPVTLPGLLRDLCRAGRDRLDVLVHDFFMVSPSYCLLDRNGQYHGPVTAAAAPQGHEYRHSDGRRVDLGTWQAAWGALLAEADEITVFSANSRSHILAAYPETAPRLVLRPHQLLAEIPRLNAPERPEKVIGVLGNIGAQKGAAVLAGLARALKGRRDLSVVLIGNIDPDFALPNHMSVHGNYKLSELGHLVARYKISCWLIPSIWPETFSYTTHECLATGLPVYAFAIGAQGDAVANHPNGHGIAFAPGADLVHNILQQIEQS